MASSSPDTHTRALPPAWTAQDGLDDIAEALDALETYKKKDASKGTSPHLGFEISDTLNAASISCRAIQGCRQCTNNAAKLLQDHCIQQISGRDSISTEGIRLEGWRSAGMYPERLKWDQTRDFLTPRYLLQFTYINLAFSPAPDDTVSNLYKVWIAA